jgi:hypothetical protein
MSYFISCAGTFKEKKRLCMCYSRRNYIDFILKICKYENTDRSSAEGAAVFPNFSATDDGRVGRNI